MRNKITTSELDEIYDLFKVYRKNKRLAEKSLPSSMNKTSALNYLASLEKMIEGEVFKRTINAEATEFFLKKIYSEYGLQGFSKSVIALENHIEYYSKVSGTKPNKKQQEIIANLTKEYGFTATTSIPLSEEIPSDLPLSEGARYSAVVNGYERNYLARKKCISIHGLECCICKFSFREKYGEIGIGFIQVHHLKELHTIGESYIVDPVKDLRPVCANCHSMLHTKRPAFTIEEMISIISAEAKK